MMPDLGKYGVEVISAYIATIAIIVGLIWSTWAASRASQRLLEQAEKRADNG
jgi:heme exporter protein CcmD